MANFQKPTEIPGQDFRIWQEILYLDSPSDYREYLPQNSIRENMHEVGLVMLDTISSPRSRSRSWPLILMAFVILASSGYLVYVFLEDL